MRKPVVARRQRKNFQWFIMKAILASGTRCRAKIQGCACQRSASEQFQLVNNVPYISLQRPLSLPNVLSLSKWKSALWILPKGFVILVRCLVDLRVANNPVAELPAVFSRLRADPEDGDIVFLVPSVLIDKGRNLGPTPRSPLTAVEKDNRRRRLFQHRWKFHRIAIDILQNRFGESCADIQ